MYKPTDLSQISPDEQQLGGWIAPDGTFYQAEYAGHYHVASNIVKYVLNANQYGNASDYLINLGWIRLETEGSIHHGFRATEQQANILYWCYTRSYFALYKDELYPKISQIIHADLCVREPLPRVPAQGDQENFRWQYAW